MPHVARHLVLAMLVALVTVALVAPAVASAATVTVKITDRLSPAELSVPAGTTIRFVNADDERHRMRSQSGPAEFDSHNLEPGESYSMTLTARGTYAYLDERDDENPRYFGRIVVGGGANSGGGASTSPASSSTSASVSMAGRAFSPGTVTIAAGGSVTFRNDDDRTHTVTADDGAFDSGSIGEGGSWKRTFKQAGTFSYLCAIHPEMTGEVVVKSSGGSGGSATAPAPAATPKPTPTPESATGSVDAQVRDFAFAPASLSVRVGSTINWHNADEAPHTVTAEDGSFDSEMIATGGSWARTFDAVGTFRYVCSFHPEMEGVVTVSAAADVAPSPTPEQSSPLAAAAAIPPPDPLTSSPPEPASAPVAVRGGLPDGELFARIAIVALLIGGALFLFARTVRGSADHAIGGEPQA